MHQVRLNTDQLKTILKHLGLNEEYKCQRIILDIDSEGIVHCYTQALLMDSNFDLFNVLLDGKKIEPVESMEVTHESGMGTIVIEYSKSIGKLLVPEFRAKLDDFMREKFPNRTYKQVGGGGHTVVLQLG